MQLVHNVNGTYEYIVFDGEFYYPDGCAYVMDDFGDLVEV